MKSVQRVAMLLLGAFILQGCLTAPKVLQGTVVSYSEETRMLVVKDEEAPNEEVAISLAGAEIGALPETGDLVRVAYVEEGGRSRALRVMNLTRQKELQKSGD
ncbi:MAG: hypothetical protein FJW35_06410 [Acidobacteria bacterium]|nr:hypothetical protein [Acidobacteriota bacterium]